MKRNLQRQDLVVDFTEQQLQLFHIYFYNIVNIELFLLILKKKENL